MGKYLIYFCVSIVYLAGFSLLAQNKLKAGDYVVNKHSYTVSLLNKWIYIKDNDTLNIKRNFPFFELDEVKATGSEDLSDIYIKIWGKHRAKKIAANRGVMLTMFINNKGRVLNISAYVRETSSLTLKEFDEFARYSKNNLVVKIPPNLDDARTVIASGFPVWIPRAVIKNGDYKIGSRLFTVTSIGHRISIMDNAVLNYTDLMDDRRFKLVNTELTYKNSIAYAFKKVLGIDGVKSLRNYQHLDIVISGWVNHQGKIIASSYYMPKHMLISVLELSKISNLIQKKVTLQVPDGISEEKVGSFTYNLPIKSLEE